MTGERLSSHDGVDPRDRAHGHDAADLATHRHPHPPDDPTGRPRIGMVGAGRVGAALGVAFSRAGWPVVAVHSRDDERAARFVERVPGAVALPSITGVTDAVDLLFLTVPDDALATVAGSVRLYGGQAIVHTSGALGGDALDIARAAGTQAGSFHPLVAFADLDGALAALPGATVAVEGDADLVAVLAQLATDIGAQPVRLPPGGKAAYHAAAVLAAGGFVGLLDGIAEVARGAGVDEAGALAIYGPLITQSLGNVQRLGIASALTGPFVRGDEGTVRAHLAALQRLAPGALELYLAVARRELAIAVARGDLPPTAAEPMERLLADASGPRRS
jgi:predicted short-subunit dehydrogenase-like oxidoreductase (DUF2520 family)